MSLVGGFPGLQNIHHRTIRSPINPMDKSTVVSIYPKSILEIKHTIQPGKFFISAGSFEKPSVLTIGPSSWWKEMEDDMPLLEIPQSSIQIANSIVVDYINGILGCDMADIMPGIFFIPGEWSSANIIREHTALLINAKTKQNNWYSLLVKMADSLWARSMGNPLAISDDMRLAANELGLKEKPWIKDFQMAELINCSACGAMRNPAYPICQTCKAVIDPERAKELKLTFAQ